MGISRNRYSVIIPLFRVTIRGLLKLFQSDVSTVRLGRSNNDEDKESKPCITNEQEVEYSPSNAVKPKLTTVSDGKSKK